MPRNDFSLTRLLTSNVVIVVVILVVLAWLSLFSVIFRV